MMDSRYKNLYTQKPNPMKGKQLDGAIVKVIPTFKETAYKNKKNK